MIKNYATYIKENRRPRYFNAFHVLNKYSSESLAEEELRQLVIGQVCVWYVRGAPNNIKKQKIADVEIRDGRRVFLNGYEVDQDFDVEIEEISSKTSPGMVDHSDPQKQELIAFPSGEVLYVTPSKMQIMLNYGAVKYEKYLNYKGVEYKDIYFFRDEDYYKIREFIDPSYKKPVKATIRKSNYDEKKTYYIDDTIVCQGSNGRLKLDDRVGKIIDITKDPKTIEKSYLVSFKVNFSPYLQNVGGTINRHCWWVKKDNIKGIYTGDIEAHNVLANMAENMEKKKKNTVKKIYTDHDGKLQVGYVYRGEDGKMYLDKPPKEEDSVKLGDDAVIWDFKKVLYSDQLKDFANVWFDKEHPIGTIVDIKYVDGVKCVMGSNLKVWYRMSGIKKGERI